MTDTILPVVDDSDQRLPDLVALIGRDSFFDDLASLLDARFGLRHFHVFRYERRRPPTVLASRPASFGYAVGMRNYVTYTYVINPVFRAFQRSVPSGLYMIADLLGTDTGPRPDGPDVDVLIEDTEAIGYRTPGWPRSMTELIMLINQPDGTALDITFMTGLSGDALARYRHALERLFPVLSSVLTKHLEIRPRDSDAATAPDQEDRFLDFGADILTTREQEVVQQILVGHGSSSIALNLDVSLTTVKTHRRNIYAKLQISSQAELFSLFLLHLK